MAETFTPINTQEEFDAAIQSRLAREKQKYADYDSLKEQLTAAQNTIATQKQTIDGHKTEVDTLNQQITEKDSKIKGFELNALRIKVIQERGLPFELADYLKGETEDELNSSAETLGKLTGGKKVPPLADPEYDPPEDSKEKAKKDATKTVLRKLRGE